MALPVSGACAWAMWQPQYQFLFSHLQRGHRGRHHRGLQVRHHDYEQSVALAAHQRALLCDAHIDVTATVLLGDCGQLRDVSANRELLQAARV